MINPLLRWAEYGEKPDFTGLLVPAGTNEPPPQHGIVLAVGAGLDWWPGAGVEMPVSPGDHVVFPFSAGAVRFNEFGEAVVGISPRMLAARLRDLEEAGMVERTVIPDSPPGVEYRLTERGRALAPLVAALHQYAAV